MVLLRSYVMGEGYPVYATYRALKSREPAAQRKWLAFWIVYSPLMVCSRTHMHVHVLLTAQRPHNRSKADGPRATPFVVLNRSPSICPFPWRNGK